MGACQRRIRLPRVGRREHHRAEAAWLGAQAVRVAARHMGARRDPQVRAGGRGWASGAPLSVCSMRRPLSATVSAWRFCSVTQRVTCACASTISLRSSSSTRLMTPACGDSAMGGHGARRSADIGGWEDARGGRTRSGRRRGGGREGSGGLLGHHGCLPVRLNRKMYAGGRTPTDDPFLPPLSHTGELTSATSTDGCARAGGRRRCPRRRSRVHHQRPCPRVRDEATSTGPPAADTGARRTSGPPPTAARPARAPRRLSPPRPREDHFGS